MSSSSRVMRSSRAAATLNIKEKKRGDVAVICQRIQKRTLFEEKDFYKNKPDCPNKTLMNKDPFFLVYSPAPILDLVFFFLLRKGQVCLQSGPLLTAG